MLKRIQAILRCMQEIANDILSEQTPKRLLDVRGKLYELLVNVVPPELIIRQLTMELLKKLDDEVKHQVRDETLPVCMCACSCSHESCLAPDAGGEMGSIL
jgi:hypothetical protein